MYIYIIWYIYIYISYDIYIYMHNVYIYIYAYNTYNTYTYTKIYLHVYIITYTWRFPQNRGTLKSFLFCGVFFHETNHPAIGVPPLIDTPKAATPKVPRRYVHRSLSMVRLVAPNWAAVTRWISWSTRKMCKMWSQGFRYWIITPNILDSTIPELVIKEQGFGSHCSLEFGQQLSVSVFLSVIPYGNSDHCGYWNYERHTQNVEYQE